jgi:hypothetical protein
MFTIVNKTEMRTIVYFILCVFFFINVVDLNAQEFSLQKILEMKQDQKYFESEMIRSGMDLANIKEATSYKYKVDGAKSYEPVFYEDKERTRDRIPTNDISKKNNNNYYYVDKKIELVEKVIWREVNFAENYNYEKNTAFSFFSLETVHKESQLPDEKIDYPPRLSSVSLTITCPPDLYKFYLNQITSNFEYSDTGMYGDMGVFYDYVSKTTSQNQEKHRIRILVYNDDSWSTIEFY